MGSPTIFSGKYTKLLTQKGLLQQGGAVNQFDGPRNYIANSSLESGTLDGWNRVKTTITSNLPSGVPTIGKLISVAPSITAFSAFSGTAPFDTYGLRFGNILSTVVAGEGIISDAFTVEPGDLGKVLTFKLYYKSDLGASTDNWSGVLGSQTWAVYIYDQTAGAWLQPAGFLGMNQNSGVGIVSGTFQSSVVSGQQYRIAVIALRNTTSTSALQIDNIYVGSQTAPIGPIVTDWVSYTPTGLWTSGVTYSGKWRRVGDSIEIEARVVVNTTPTATNLVINIPSQFTIDSSKLSSPDFLTTVFGVGHAFDVSTSAHYNLQAGLSGNGVFLTYQNQLTGQVIGITNTVPFTFAAGDWVDVTFKVPVQGWSSSVQMSNDTDTRVVAASYSRSTAQSILAATDTVVVYDTRRIDTHAAMNTSNGRFYAPVSGVYRITASVFYNFFTPVAGNPLQLRFRKRDASGTVIEDLYKDNFTANAAVGQEIALRSAAQFYCNAGEQLEVVLWQNTGGTRTTIAGINFVEIERLSGPSVVAASETVAAVYQTGAGQSIPNNTVTPIVYGTKVFDTHSAMNASTGVYTVPVSGTFEVKASHYFGTAITATATDVQTIVQVDGISMFGSNLTKSGTVAAPLTTLGSFLVKANAGQTIRIALLQSNSTGSAQSLLANVTFNWISINRVGN